MASMQRGASWLSKELGLTTLVKSSRDVHLLMLTRVIRMFAYGSSTLILALFFSALGFSDTMIGLFMTLTLVGDVAISLGLTIIADRLGRRRILVLGALLMTLSGVVFATVSNYWVLLLAAIVGVISPSGNEIGPFRAVEESTIAHLSDAATRADLFALYVVGGTLGTSVGALLCGWLTDSLHSRGWDELNSFRLVFWLYALVGLVKAFVSLFLSRQCELEEETKPISEAGQIDDRHSAEDREQEPLLNNNNDNNTAKDNAYKKKSWIQLSSASRIVVAQLCGLFFFDSLASGMIPSSLIAYFISRKFAVSKGTLGTIIAVSQFVSSLGNIFASSVARRIGLVKTMVFTHLPSAIFTALLPLPNELWLTIVLLVARSSLSSMDQAPRSAFLSAIVRPEERTTVMGIVNTVKTSSQSGGPLITGVLAGGGQFWIAFVVAGALKAGYDLAMLRFFASARLEGDRSDAQSTPTRSEEEGQGNEIEERNGN